MPCRQTQKQSRSPRCDVWGLTSGREMREIWGGRPRRWMRIANRERRDRGSLTGKVVGATPGGRVGGSPDGGHLTTAVRRLLSGAVLNFTMCTVLPVRHRVSPHHTSLRAQCGREMAADQGCPKLQALSSVRDQRTERVSTYVRLHTSRCAT